MTHQTATRQTASRRRAGLLTAALLAGLCAGLGTAQSQPAGPPPAAAAPAGPPSGFPPMPPPGPTKHMPWGAPDVTGVWAFVPDENANPVAALDLVTGPAGPELNIGGTNTVPAEFLRWPRSLVHGGTADNQVPYQAWAKAKRLARKAHLYDPRTEDESSTSGRCLLFGVPASMLRPNPHVYQFPDHILMEWEYPQMHRIIWTDGRSPPPPEVKLWQGFSVGHWDGDTLVVTTTNLSAFPWMDGTGNFLTDNAKLTEHVKVDGTMLAYKVDIEDASAYTQSWWMEWKFGILRPGAMPPMPPGAKPPAGGAPGAKPPGSDAKIGDYGLPTDVNAFNAMATGEMLEVACVEGERTRTLERFQHTKAKN